MWPSLPMVALSVTTPFAPVCLAIFGYSGSLREISTACWIWPPCLAPPLVSVTVSGGAAGAGVRLAEGGAIGAFGTAPAEGRLTPGMAAEAEPLAVGASGISVASAGRMRWASDAVLNSLRGTTGLGASCTGSSAGLGLAGVEVATCVGGVFGVLGVLAFLVGGAG